MRGSHRGLFRKAANVMLRMRDMQVMSFKTMKEPGIVGTAVRFPPFPHRVKPIWLEIVSNPGPKTPKQVKFMCRDGELMSRDFLLFIDP